MEFVMPKKRSPLRLKLGKMYFTARRHLQLAFSGYHFGRVCEDSRCTFKWMEHSTPLLRKLRDVDMQLQYNKIQNLKCAVPHVNGVTLKPGEVFSYWRLIGKPTRAKGYVDGMVLFCGTYHPGVGGGLCQLSNLIYWMTLHTPLTVVERYRHSYDVFPDANRTQPFGSGATCVYNYRDLVIRNDTQSTFRLEVWLDEERLHGRWMSDMPQSIKYEVYEKNHMFRHEAPGFYTRNNEIWRRAFTMDGALLEDEKITENHALMMYPPLLSEAQDGAAASGSGNA